MVCKNEGKTERVIRILLGGALLSWGYWTSGDYWLSYTVPTYQLPCWEWDNFVSLGCLIERGFIVAFIGLIPLVTGLIGWCPLKSLFRLKG